jgi:hypothetical protein
MVAIVVCCWLSWPEGQQAGAVDIDVSPRQPAFLEPGTVVGNRAPKGWSHLVIRTVPRIDDDSRDAVSDGVARLAAMLFTAVVADVRRDNGAYSLATVAVGVGAKVNDDPTILTSATQAKLGANFSWLERQVLSAGEKQVDQMLLAARSPTMAILDAPSIMLHEGKHRNVIFRYLLLIDPENGRLQTLVWPLLKRKNGEGLELIGPAEVLKANTVDDFAMHVDSDEFIFGVPTTMSFATKRPPLGERKLRWPESLKAVAAESPLSAAEAAKLERELRKLLAEEANGER